MYIIRGERVASIEPMDPGSIITDFTDRFGPADMLLEVWCTEEEIGEALGEEGDQPGSEPPGKEDNTARQ